MKPQRTFTADVGQWSVDNAGPDAIERDFDNVNKMFDPDSTFPGGEKGGIKAENLSTELNGLAGSGDSSLHYHSSDRKRENHTGTQPSNTISDFAVAVRNTVLTGLSTAANRVITATDSVLTSSGLLQKQITDLDAAAVHKTGNETISGVKTLSSSPIVPYPASDAQAASKKYVDDVAAPKANASDVYTKSNLQTSGQSAVHWSNLTNVPNFGDPHWKPPVANRAALPLTGNALQDTRTVLDDGDGKQAIYNCVATTGTVNQQWAKVADVDWMADEATRATQEAARVTAENGRISAESTRVTTEGARVTAENARASAEGARITAENARSSEELSRVGFENTRRSSEILRNSEENLRASAESTRQTNESNRGNAESVRVAIESIRQTNETARSNAESARQSNEVTRQTNEANRGAAENDRATAENNRVLAENNRAAAENARAVFEAYNAETAYIVGNKVSYEGASYTCIANSTGNLPTNENYWLCIVAGVLANGSNVLLTGYSKPVESAPIEATDNLNAALGKIEKKFDETPSDVLVKGLNIQTIPHGEMYLSIATLAFEEDGVGIGFARTNRSGDEIQEVASIRVNDDAEDYSPVSVGLAYDNNSLDDIHHSIVVNRYGNIINGVTIVNGYAYIEDGLSVSSGEQHFRVDEERIRLKGNVLLDDVALRNVNAAPIKIHPEDWQKDYNGVVPLPDFSGAELDVYDDKIYSCHDTPQGAFTYFMYNTNSDTVYFSTDVENWTITNLNGSPNSFVYNSFFNRYFCLSYDDIAERELLKSSTDGINWTDNSNSVDLNLTPDTAIPMKIVDKGDDYLQLYCHTGKAVHTTDLSSWTLDWQVDSLEGEILDMMDYDGEVYALGTDWLDVIRVYFSQQPHTYWDHQNIYENEYLSMNFVDNHKGSFYTDQKLYICNAYLDYLNPISLPPYTHHLFYHNQFIGFADASDDSDGSMATAVYFLQEDIRVFQQRTSIPDFLGRDMLHEGRDEGEFLLQSGNKFYRYSSNGGELIGYYYDTTTAVRSGEGFEMVGKLLGATPHGKTAVEVNDSKTANVVVQSQPPYLKLLDLTPPEKDLSYLISYHIAPWAY